MSDLSFCIPNICGVDASCYVFDKVADMAEYSLYDGIILNASRCFQLFNKFNTFEDSKLKIV